MEILVSDIQTAPPPTIRQMGFALFCILRTVIRHIVSSLSLLCLTQ